MHVSGIAFAVVVVRYMRLEFVSAARREHGCFVAAAVFCSQQSSVLQVRGRLHIAFIWVLTPATK